MFAKKKHALVSHVRARVRKVTSNIMGGTNSKQQPKSTQSTETSSANKLESSVDPPANKLESSVDPPSNERKGSSQEHHEIERYQNVFKTYYATLCDAIPAEEVLPHLVSNDVITVREMEDILVEKTTFRQARALLNGPIWRSISGGYPNAFVTLLCVLRSIHSCETLCEAICRQLGISCEVMSNESREFNYRLLWFNNNVYNYVLLLCIA